MILAIPFLPPGSKENAMLCSKTNKSNDLQMCLPSSAKQLPQCYQSTEFRLRPLVSPAFRFLPGCVLLSTLSDLHRASLLTLKCQPGLGADVAVIRLKCGVAVMGNSSFGW